MFHKLQIIFKFCFHFFDQRSLTYSANLCRIYSCSDDLCENTQGIPTPSLAASLFHSSTVFNEEVAHIQEYTQQFFCFYLYTQLHTYHVREKTVDLHQVQVAKGCRVYFTIRAKRPTFSKRASYLGNTSLPDSSKLIKELVTIGSNWSSSCTQLHGMLQFTIYSLRF